jgi:hypothetical protein
VTELLDRLDDTVADTTGRWDRQEFAGWLCIGIGGLVAVLSAGGVVALYLWGDLLTVKDLP